mgnify:CR=1 FL=1
MNVIKLESNFFKRVKPAIFYFNNMEDCNIFINSLIKYHMCNINWKPPIEVPISDVPLDKIEYLKLDPIERADNNWSILNARLRVNYEEYMKAYDILFNPILSLERICVHDWREDYEKEVM